MCLPFHYHFESIKSCSEIKADTNAIIERVLTKDSERCAPVLFILFEIRAGVPEHIKQVVRSWKRAVCWFSSFHSSHIRLGRAAKKNLPSSYSMNYLCLVFISDWGHIESKTSVLINLGEKFRVFRIWPSFWHHLLHRYLMRIKIFCPENKIWSKSVMNMLICLEWLEGRREPL